MYTVTSNAGLHHNAATIEHVAQALAQHLHDQAADQPVHWKITTPHGTTHLGHVDLNGLPDQGFLTDTITEISNNLNHEANQYSD